MNQQLFQWIISGLLTIALAIGTIYLTLLVGESRRTAEAGIKTAMAVEALVKDLIRYDAELGDVTAEQQAIRDRVTRLEAAAQPAIP